MDRKQVAKKKSAGGVPAPKLQLTSKTELPSSSTELTDEIDWMVAGVANATFVGRVTKIKAPTRLLASEERASLQLGFTPQN